MNRFRSLAAALLLVASACSSHGSSGMLPQAASATSPVKPASGKTGATLSIKVPRPSAATSSNRRSPKYVSPSSTQLLVAVNGGKATAYGLTTQSPGCSVQVTTLNCSFSIAAPAGQDSFTLTLEDAAGTALSKNIVPAKLTAGQSTPVNVTLDAIPVAVQLVPGPGALVEGTGNPSWHFPGLFAQTLEAQPLDADNNVIIGPGAPNITKVSVTAGGQFATVKSAGTQDTEAFVLTPAGGSAAGQTITVSAAAQGVALSDGTTSSPITTSTNFTFTPAIATSNGASISVYSVETGNLVTQFCVTCGATAPISALVSDPSDGTLYAVVTGFIPSPQSTVITFPPGSSKASNSLTSTNGIGLVHALALDKNGTLYVGNAHAFRGPAASLEEFPKGATTASVKITGGVVSPTGLAVDGSGNVYSVDGAGINIYGPGNQTGPSQTITDPNLVQPTDIAMDSAGNFYVSDTNTGNPQIAYFTAGSTSSPTFLSDQSLFNWGSAGTIMLDPSGNLWTELFAENEIVRYDGSLLPGSLSINEFLTNVPASGMAWIP